MSFAEIRRNSGYLAHTYFPVSCGLIEPFECDGNSTLVDDLLLLACDCVASVPKTVSGNADAGIMQVGLADEGFRMGSGNVSIYISNSPAEIK